MRPRHGPPRRGGDGRFAATVGVAGLPGWRPVRDLLRGGVPGLILVEQGLRDTTSSATAGSLFLLEYARRLSWPVLSVHLREDAWLDPGVDNVHTRPDQLGRARLGFGTGPAPDRRSTADVVHRLVADHLVQVVGIVGVHTGVERQVLWSNVAAAMGGAFLALSWGSPDRCRYLDAATAALQAEPDLAGTVTLSGVEQGGERWMMISRHRCCLAFRAGSGARCGSCPLLDERERLRRFRRAAARFRAVEIAAFAGG